MGKRSREVRNARIAVASSARDSVFAAVAQLGVVPLESLIDAKVPSPHWRFKFRGKQVMHYWPATCRFWTPGSDCWGTCDLGDIVRVLRSEVKGQD